MMTASDGQAFERSAFTSSYPIAAACRRFLDHPPEDSWREWEVLSRDVLHALLQYLSHVLLSDLVASGKQPAHLFHRIGAILSRPMARHYAGFLRETARYYRDAGIECAMPELTALLLAAEVDMTVPGDGKQLIGRLVDYRP